MAFEDLFLRYINPA